MKIVRPYVGPNSYDFRTADGVLVTAFGCFDPELELQTSLAVYSELLTTLCSDRRGLVVQFQSHRWQRVSDEGRLDSLSGRWRGSEWLAFRAKTPEALLGALREFWTDKEMRFYSVAIDRTISEELLERWFRLYLDDFDGRTLEDLSFVAEEIWGQSFVLLRTAAIPLSTAVGALSAAGERHGVVFVQQREPFLAHLGPA